MFVSAGSKAFEAVKPEEAAFDFEATWRTHYARVARVIARVLRDRARAEDLAIEVFLKLWRRQEAQGENVEGWLYRAAVRKSLDELRRRARRARYESLFRWTATRNVRTPEELFATNEEQARTHAILASIGRRQSELLVLRSQGLTYEELASALEINPASVGTLLSRAQNAFRKEYIRRYEKE